jgi:hypothetical protein
MPGITRFFLPKVDEWGYIVHDKKKSEPLLADDKPVLHPQTREPMRKGEPVRTEAWADLHYRPSFAQVKAFIKASRSMDAEEAFGEFVHILATGWSLVDEENQPIPMSREGIGSADGAAVKLIGTECLRLMGPLIPNL